MSVAPVLELRDVSFGYTSRDTVIHGVSASVEAARLLVVLGPNACGKSTLLKLMLGSLRPRAGEVLLGGSSIASISARERAARMSYVPQHSTVGFQFTVRETVELGRYVLEDDREALAAALRIAEIDDLAERSVAELSSGQQQRVLLARSVYQSGVEGRVMLLDEPVSSMDLYHVHETIRTLRSIAERGVAVVAVLQDINLAARYADDVWLMKDGALVSVGAWNDVLSPDALEQVYGVQLVRETKRDHDGDEDDDLRPRFDVRWQ
jgi:iron complex transport system ATP-binding protein